jgi:hypothetical protein
VNQQSLHVFNGITALVHNVPMLPCGTLASTRFEMVEGILLAPVFSYIDREPPDQAKLLCSQDLDEGSCGDCVSEDRRMRVAAENIPQSLRRTVDA